MSERILFKHKNYGLNIIEVFGREIQIGDIVIFSPNFAFYFDNNYVYKRAPLCRITEKGLCWHDDLTDEYTVIFENIDKLFESDTEDDSYEIIEIFVYKVNVGQIEKDFLKNSSDYYTYYDVTSLEDNQGLDEKDVLLRKAKAGDFVLVSLNNDMSIASYMLFTASNMLYNGYYQCDFMRITYYIITEPTEDELKIKRDLILRYNQYMYYKLNCVVNGLRRGDYFSAYNGTMQIYLGHTKKGLNIYLCFAFYFADKIAGVLDKVKEEGLDSNNFLNYINSVVKAYEVILKPDFETSRMIDEMYFGTEYAGHIEIKVANQEIFDALYKGFDELIERGKFFEIKQYDDLDKLNEDKDIILEKSYAKYQKQALKLIEKFDGDFESYKEQMESLEDDGAFEWYANEEYRLFQLYS